MRGQKHPFLTQHKAGLLKAMASDPPCRGSAGGNVLTQPQFSFVPAAGKKKNVFPEDFESSAHTHVDHGLNSHCVTPEFPSLKPLHSPNCAFKYFRGETGGRNV